MSLGKGDVDFPAVHRILLLAGPAGWCTVERDRDPRLDKSSIEDARADGNCSQSIGFE